MKKPHTHEANVFLPGILGPVRRDVVLLSDFDEYTESLRARLANYEDAEGRPVVQLSAEAYQQAANCLYVLREIGSMDADDISGDDVDLRFEDGEGRDTGCDVSIVEYAERSAVAIEALFAALESQAREIERLKESAGNWGKWCAQAVKELAALKAQAAPVDERSAFEVWYLGHFYMGDKQCGLEWLSTEPCGGYRHQHPAEQWVVWQARAALSAPSHGEQVREVVPEEWRTMLSRVVDELDSLNCNMRDQIDDDMADPDEEAELCDATDELIDEARALIAAAPSAGSQEQGE